MTDHPAPRTYTLRECNWELTLKCMMNCIHCGSRAGRARTNELSQDECFRVADQLAGLGCKEVTLIGGEVFLFSGWDRLSEYLSGKGVSVNIVTNGYRIGEPQIEQIKRSRVTNVGLSIDGMESNHNHIRGKPDAFQRLRNALEVLDKEGIPTAAVTTLMKFNLTDLEDLYAFLVEHHVRGWQLQLAIPMGNLAEREDFVIDPDRVRDLTEFVREKSLERRMRVIAADSIGYFDENETYIRGASSPICFWGGCGAGTSGVFIDSIGNVKGCGALYADTFIEGNLRKTSLADIWNSSSTFLYNRNFTTDLLSGKCKECDVGDVCRGGCRSANYFTTQSLYSNIFCCRTDQDRI